MSHSPIVSGGLSPIANQVTRARVTEPSNERHAVKNEARVKSPEWERGFDEIERLRKGAKKREGTAHREAGECRRCQRLLQAPCTHPSILDKANNPSFLFSRVSPSSRYHDDRPVVKHIPSSRSFPTLAISFSADSLKCSNTKAKALVQWPIEMSINMIFSYIRKKTPIFFAISNYFYIFRSENSWFLTTA